jgi:hypothetical protein
VAFKQCGEALVKPQVGISINARFEFLERYKKVEVTAVRIKLARSR